MYTEDVQSLTLGCRRTCCFTDGYWEPELLFSKIPQTDQANYTHPSSRSIGKCQEGWGQGQEVCKVLVSTLRVGTRGRGRSRVPYRMFMRQNRLAILFPRSHAPRGNARPGTLPRPVSHVHAAKSVSDSLDAGASKTCVPARSVGTRKKTCVPTRSVGTRILDFAVLLGAGPISVWSAAPCCRFCLPGGQAVVACSNATEHARKSEGKPSHSKDARATANHGAKCSMTKRNARSPLCPRSFRARKKIRRGGLPATG